MEGPAAIEFDRATVLRGGRTVLDEIRFVVGAGERVCVLGPNGSGKSTMVGLIAGELRALHREPAAVRLFGHSLWDLFELRSRLGMVSDRLHSLHAREEEAGDVLLSAYFGSVGLPSRVDIDDGMLRRTREVASFLRIESLLHRMTSTLSSGEMRRVLLGRALVHDPSTMLLDEPFTSLDIGARARLASTLSELAALGKGMVLVTHELSEIPAEMSRVVMVRHGRILTDGPIDELIRDEPLSELYGLRLKVHRIDGHFSAQAL